MTQLNLHGSVPSGDSSRVMTTVFRVCRSAVLMFSQHAPQCKINYVPHD